MWRMCVLLPPQVNSIDSFISIEIWICCNKRAMKREKKQKLWLFISSGCRAVKTSQQELGKKIKNLNSGSCLQAAACVHWRSLQKAQRDETIWLNKISQEQRAPIFKFFLGFHHSVYRAPTVENIKKQIKQAGDGATGISASLFLLSVLWIKAKSSSLWGFTIT